MKKLIVNILILFFTVSDCCSLDLIEFKTDINKSSIELNKVLPGGPGKDGIPALNNPKFDKLNTNNMKDSELGLFVNIGGIQKFYPLNILVWHEIVNDQILETYLLVTFCPLCGSGIVFNRELNGVVYIFGVSGYLYESNLLMYDNKTESLWSQSKGEAVVGAYTGKKLDIIPVSVLDFKTVKLNYPKTLILSKDTGFIRNYNYYPYGNYNTNEKLYFPTSKFSEKYHLKENMYVFKYKKSSYAFSVKDLGEKEILYDINDTKALIKKNKGEIKVYIDNKLIPGYYEMWFSWFIHNSSNGVVIEIDK